MSEPFLAQINMFAGTFNPRGWAFCSGQLLSIAQNSALFSLLGTIYGGDGRVTFGLPDLRGRCPRGSQGNSAGPGLAAVQLGERGGAVEHVMTIQQMPAHSHADTAGTVEAKVGDFFGDPTGQTLYLTGAGGVFNSPTEFTSNMTLDNSAPDIDLGSGIGTTGNNQPFNVLDPYLGINFIIATVGLFPSRN